ncbi:MAG: amidohydrolase family protein [Chloroflexota bacterium]
MSRLLLRNLTVIDVRQARSVPDAAILIEGETIIGVGSASGFANEAKRAHAVDCGRRYLIPGLIDPHVHVAFNGKANAIEDVGGEDDPSTWQQASKNVAAALRSGVTTMADCGAPGGFSGRLKTAIERGELPGPRLEVCLAPITTRIGHCHHFGAIAGGERDLAATTERLVHGGASFIKVMASGGATGGSDPSQPQYSEKELRAVVEVAHASGRGVAAHCRSAQSTRFAVNAGVDRLEHVTWETTGGVAYDAQLAGEIARRGIWVDPTLPAGYRAARSPEISAARRVLLTQKFDDRYPNYRRMAREAGLRLLCGTDAGTPFVAFDDFALAPELLVQVAEYTPAQALASATIWGAESLGLAESRGSIEPRKLADLVLLEADPLLSPSALRCVAGVMVGGRWRVQPIAHAGGIS